MTSIQNICKKGNLDEIKKIVNKENINEIFNYCCYYNNLTNINALLNFDKKIYGDIIINNDTMQSACKSKNINIFKLLLSLDTNKSIEMHSYNEVIFRRICDLGCIDIIKLLLSLEPVYGQFNIHVIDEIIFKNSCFFGNLEVLKLLISLENTHKKINININCDEVFTNACCQDNVEIIKYLLSLNRNINIHVNNGYGFIQACSRGHINIIKYLLSLDNTHGKIATHINSDEAFRRACINKHLSVVKLLLSLDIIYYKQTDIHAHNELAFRHACLNGDLELVNLLLSIQKDYGKINIYANDNEAFKMSCLNNHVEVVKLLLGKVEDGPSGKVEDGPSGKVECDDKDKKFNIYDNNLFQECCFKNNFDIVKLLISLDTNKKINIYYKNNILFQRAYDISIEMTKFFIDIIDNDKLYVFKDTLAYKNDPYIKLLIQIKENDFINDKQHISIHIDNCVICESNSLYFFEYNCNIQGTQNGNNNHLICLNCLKTCRYCYLCREYTISCKKLYINSNHN